MWQGRGMATLAGSCDSVRKGKVAYQYSYSCLLMVVYLFMSFQVVRRMIRFILHSCWETCSSEELVSAIISVVSFTTEALCLFIIIVGCEHIYIYIDLDIYYIYIWYIQFAGIPGCHKTLMFKMVRVMPPALALLHAQKRFAKFIMLVVIFCDKDSLFTYVLNVA